MCYILTAVFSQVQIDIVLTLLSTVHHLMHQGCIEFNWETKWALRVKRKANAKPSLV